MAVKQTSGAGRQVDWRTDRQTKQPTDRHTYLCFSLIIAYLFTIHIYWLLKRYRLSLPTVLTETWKFDIGSNRNVEIWYWLNSNKWIIATMLFANSIIVVYDRRFMQWRHLLQQHLMPLRLITWPILIQNVFHAFSYILRKINLAIVFECVRSIIADFYCHFSASRYKCRSPKKDFQVRKSRIINCNICTSVTSVLRPSDVKTSVMICESQSNIVANV